MFYYSHSEIGNNLVNEVLHNYYLCAKLSLVYTFYKRLIENELDVYTQYGDVVYRTSIRYELQKLLYKIDNCIYDDFDYNKLR